MASPSFQRTFTACLAPVSLAHSPPSYSKTLQSLRNVRANQILTIREQAVP